MPRLRVYVGTSPDDLARITPNDSRAHTVRSDRFEGALAVHIAGLRGTPQEYFAHPARAKVTWSIQVQGRFLVPVDADDVLFGNTFDRPLKLPWGAGAALKFMHFVDPALEHELDGPRPWALSPLLATMPYLAHTRAPTPPPSFPSHTPLVENSASLTGSPRVQRRPYFRSASARARTILGPRDVITADFCYGFLSFPSLRLSLPGGISFDCTRYWDGQPVRFVCCERAPDGRGPGTPFWCVVFEVVEDGEEDSDASSLQSAEIGADALDNPCDEID